MFEDVSSIDLPSRAIHDTLNQQTPAKVRAVINGELEHGIPDLVEHPTTKFAVFGLVTLGGRRGLGEDGVWNASSAGVMDRWGIDLRCFADDKIAG
jgi:hypothetical protein